MHLAHVLNLVYIDCNILYWFVYPYSDKQMTETALFVVASSVGEGVAYDPIYHRIYYR